MRDDIKKLYIEATSNCNLSCPMCSRNYWVNEKKGDMDFSLFEKVVSEVKNIGAIETIFFGGIGEPFVHPRIIDMIKKAKATGRNVEAITNGTMLDEENIQKIIDSRLDRLWVSMDSLDEKQYSDIRSGADYKSLNDRLRNLKDLRIKSKSSLKVGISFVIMKKNADMLPKLPFFAEKYDISDIKVTNLVPNTKGLNDELMYKRSLAPGPIAMVSIDIPLFDMTDDTKNLLYGLLTQQSKNISLMDGSINRKTGYCRFVNEGNVFIRWDGEICPCMAILHSGKTFLYDTERSLDFASFGNLKNKSLLEIWESEDYTAFRKRVRNFDFSPCTMCGGCDDLTENKTDCFGNQFPVCGGCLWAQGFIQCP